MSRVALVTGGGTGIGAACCRALASEGFRVAVHYRSSEEKAQKLAAELPGAFAVRADLDDAEQVTFLDPDRTIETYMASLGEEPTHDAFMREATRQSKYTWRHAFTAATVNAYVREGFQVVVDP